MKSNKLITNIKNPPYYYPQYASSVFGINLCNYLNDPIQNSDCVDIRHFYKQCSGTTCKNTRCRHKVKVEVAYDSAETDSPKVYCSKHAGKCSNPDRRDFNLVIQETKIPDETDPDTFTTNHHYVWVGFGTPMLEDTDTVAYQVLNYVGDDPKPRPRLLEEGQLYGFDCDKGLWIDPNTYVRIYYVREAGKISRSQVSAQNQLDTNLQAYKDKVEDTMKCAGTGDCAVCLENKPLRNLGCNHNFCVDCIARFSYKKATCPMCRAEIPCLTEMTNNQKTLDRLQIDSPDYEVKKTEINADCVHAFAYKITITADNFRYPDLYFSPQQEIEYRLLVLLLETKLVFVNSSYDDQVYVRTRLFGNTLMDRLRSNDKRLVQEIVEHGMDCGITEILPPTFR